MRCHTCALLRCRMWRSSVLPEERECVRERERLKANNPNIPAATQWLPSSALALRAPQHPKSSASRPRGTSTPQNPAQPAEVQTQPSQQTHVVAHHSPNPGVP